METYEELARRIGLAKAYIPEKYKSMFIQRDLEDQINEEKLIQKTKTMEKEVKISEVVKLIRSGFSRYRKADDGTGSIQEKYNLSWRECQELFNHPKLKGIRRKKAKIKIIDDTVNQEQATSQIVNPFN